MTSDLEVKVQERDGISVIRMTGDVTAATGQMVEDAYSEVIEAGSSRIILAFDGENYINSGGIAFIIGIAAASRGRGQVIRVAGLSEHFQKIFDMMGLTRYMDLFPTLESALEGFQD